MIKKIFSEILVGTINKFDCLVNGHLPFNNGDGKVLRLIQPRNLGNQTREVHICERCDQFYVIKGELTEQELAAEEVYLRKQEEMKEQLLQKTEEYLKKFAEQAVEKDGKSALN